MTRNSFEIKSHDFSNVIVYENLTFLNRISPAMSSTQNSTDIHELTQDESACIHFRLFLYSQPRNLKLSAFCIIQELESLRNFPSKTERVN